MGKSPAKKNAGSKKRKADDEFNEEDDAAGDGKEEKKGKKPRWSKVHVECIINLFLWFCFVIYEPFLPFTINSFQLS